MALGEYGGSIANPQRTLIVNYNIEKVKQAIRLSYHYVSDIKLEQCSFDDVLNIYTLHLSEVLSLGSNMILLLTKEDENKTKIVFEMQRAYGSYNSSVEIDYANKQLNMVCDALSTVLSMTEDDIEKLRTGKMIVPSTKVKSAKSGWGCTILLTIIIIGLLIWILS
ncbi:MAG: hypothetical protein IKO77_03340 [Bacteroidales bacterium]|nr:hypothetical protein [Bacteroidales bacterium]